LVTQDQDCNFAAAMSAEKQIKRNATGNTLFKGWSFDRINYLFLLAGIILIVLGYVVMAMGETNSFWSLTLAPILLFLGYLVMVPLALIYRHKSDNQ